MPKPNAGRKPFDDSDDADEPVVALSKHEDWEDEDPDPMEDNSLEIDAEDEL